MLEILKLLLGYLAVGSAIGLAMWGFDIWLRRETLATYGGWMKRPVFLVVVTFLWPLVIGVVVLLFRYWLWAGQRVAARLHPPYCSNILRFEVCQEGRIAATFFLPAEEVEAVIARRVHDHPHRSDVDDRAILGWLAQRNRVDETAVCVPDFWPRFELVANELCRTGSASVFCHKCGTEYSGTQLIYLDEENQAGWNHSMIQCPRKHLLLRYRRMHILMQPDLKSS